MRTLRPSSEDEMVATFLAAELTSPRFKLSLTETLAKLGHPQALITQADLSDPVQNKQRRQVLGDFRGYRQNRELFTGFPEELSWQLEALTPPEFLNILYIDYSYWTALTNGTRRPTDAAQFIRHGGLVFDHLPTEDFLHLADLFRTGTTWEPLICVRAAPDTPLVVLEGHSRLTAMALAANQLPHETPSSSAPPQPSPAGPATRTTHPPSRCGRTSRCQCDAVRRRLDGLRVAQRRSIAPGEAGAQVGAARIHPTTEARPRSAI
ncbi:hypothetical protein [Kribbella sp. DT2]|uniref:hypothetical protein n=1 Tax=Kribbella sp. DT2 TaxID=3393427 RepID=UPI003CF3C9F3